MGLDMYLNKRTYVQNWDFMKPEELHEVTVKKAKKVRKDINKSKVKYIVEEAGYWRKANAIHKWFVDNCQEGVDDCRSAYVSTEQLKKLLNICETVYAAKNEVLSGSMLPVQEGFFFGSYEYNDWYYGYIKNTIDIIKECLASIQEGGSQDFFYESSW